MRISPASALTLGKVPRPMPEPSVSIVVPAFNEERTIREVLRRVAGMGLASEILVVDDGSADGTVGIVRSLEDEIEGLRLL